MKATFFLFILFFLSCNEETGCIEEMKEEFIKQNSNQSFTSISTFELDGDSYYIFDSGVAFDAIANVVDDQCNTVCSFGGFRSNSPLPCDAFQEGINRARRIWPE